MEFINRLAAALAATARGLPWVEGQELTKQRQVAPLKASESQLSPDLYWSLPLATGCFEVWTTSVGRQHANA